MTLFADTAGERLDAFLARQPGNLSRSGAQRLIEEGMVTRNGVPGKKNDRLNVGDRVEYTIPEAKPVDIVPTEMPLDIVYEDDDLLVINKPKGLVVHPAAGHADDTLVNGLLYALGDDLSGINGVSLGSDAFFPFSDNIQRAYKSGVRYIAETGGSVRDDLVIAEADRLGITMAFTGCRLFHH